MNCQRCGREVEVDFRVKLRRCSGCSRGPAYCTCSPVQAPVRWLRHLTARDETGRVVAA